MKKVKINLTKEMEEELLDWLYADGCKDGTEVIDLEQNGLFKVAYLKNYKNYLVKFYFSGWCRNQNIDDVESEDLDFIEIYKD